MADETTQQTAEASSTIQTLEAAVTKLGGVVDKLTKSLFTGSGEVKNFVNGAKAAVETSQKAAVAVADFSFNTENLSGKLFETIKAHKDLIGVGADVILSLKMISQGTTGAGISLTAYSDKFKEVTASSTKFAEDSIKVMQMIGADENLIKAYDSFIKVTNEVKNFENAIMSAAQTGGNFYKVYDDGGASLVEQNQNVMNQVAKDSFETSNLLGLHFEEGLARTIEIMQTLPGEFGKIYSNVKVGTEDFALKTTEILSMTARGIGISYKEGLEVAKSMLYKFGADAIQSAERLAVLSTASKELGFNFEDLKGLASDLDSRFSMWGDQLSGMVTVLNDVSKALEGTNVGMSGQIELVKRLSQGVSDMQLPMRSFIGMMSGMRSPGGAVGVGLNIERMLQEGRSGEVVGMIQQTMERMTGRGAVTLQEATEDPRAQRAFLTQRSLIEQMTGAKGPEANRLLEVMSKAQVGGSGMIDAQNALSEAMSSGNDIASKQVDVTAMNTTNLIALNNTLKATNELYTSFVENLSAKPAGLLAQQNAGAMFNVRDQAALDSTTFVDMQKSFNTEEAQKVMNYTAEKIFEGFTAAMGKQAFTGLDVLTSTAKRLAEASGEGSEELDKFSTYIMNFVNKARESISSFSGSVKEMADQDNWATLSANLMRGAEPAGLPAIKPEEAKKIEIEPIKITLDLNIKDDDGNAIINRVVDIVGRVAQNISAGQGTG